MKKLVYKNVKGYNPRKNEVSIEEISSRTKCQVSKKWIHKYFIKDKFTSPDPDELRRWIEERKKEGCRKDCHILRTFNTRIGENKIICKVLGDIFVICGRTAYKIVYINELKLQKSISVIKL